MEFPAPPSSALSGVVQVALDVPLETTFDYLQDAGLDVAAGDLVIVPFQSRARVGIVVATGVASSVSPDRLRSINAKRDDAPRLPAQWLALMRFVAGYYQRPVGETMVSALPPRLRSPRPLPRQPFQAFALVESGEARAPRSREQVRLLDALKAGPVTPVALAAALACDVATLRRRVRVLVRRGWVRTVPAPTGNDFMSPHPLSPAQDAAAAAFTAALGRFEVFLLHGVTGSGKTEVYLHAIAEAIRRDRQALVLVPEISLTPQLEQRVRSAFPAAAIAILHSGLEDTARTGNWLMAARGDASIVLGTRLAALAPLPRLGLIVVDEEHDASFKQQDGVRYSARDVAVYRAKLADCPVVLGTATPSLESWFNVVHGRYRRIDLPQRAVAGAQLPQVRIIDLRRQPVSEGIADVLCSAITERLARHEQSLVFINRRGYAPVLTCPACDWAAGCDRCSAHVVLHLRARRLRCHHCGAERAIPRQCPGCGNPDLRPLGRGTQRVEEFLAARFPDARVFRLDRDTARRREHLADMLARAHRGDADILVGTQLLAKGHDFPLLTLVGVLNADAALLSTDYRAGERLFATLSQVAGRAGRRGRTGEVLVQTRYPDHPVFRALVDHDYAGFAASLLRERESAGFPPYVHEAVVRAEASHLETAIGFLRNAAARAPDTGQVQVYDPVPNALVRRADVDRAHLLVQSGNRAALQRFLMAWSPRLNELAGRGLRWQIDVDPVEFD